MIGRSVSRQIMNGRGNEGQRANSSENSGKNSKGRSKQEFRVEERAAKKRNEVEYGMEAARIAQDEGVSIVDAMDILDARIDEEERLENEQKLAEGALDATVIRPANVLPEGDQEENSTSE